MLTIIIVVVAIIGIVVFASLSQRSPETKQKMDELVRSVQDATEFKKTEHYKSRISLGQYVGGHPNADIEISDCYGYFKDGSLNVFQLVQSYHVYQKFNIELNSIKDLLVEDASTFDKRVTLGRVLLVGVFALAWKKKKKDAMAILSIEWNDGRFNHSTLFYFEGSTSMNLANTARNAIIKATK